MERVARLMLAAIALAACARDRSTTPAQPTFADDVAPILTAHCAGCHSGATPAAGWSVSSYVQTIACVSPSGAPATLPASSRAPMVAALAEAPHVGLLSDGDAAMLLAWVQTDAAAFAGTVHVASVADPRSAGFHGTSLRAARWRPMLDATDPNACGRCHDGTFSRPEDVTAAAPGAPSCASCHDQPGGVLACPTCHGSGTRAYPPRDPCFFATTAAIGAHAAHVEVSNAKSTGLPCSTCHPTPGASVIGGLHGDGTVEVAFDPSAVGPEASYDSATGACAVSCHDRGGARPRPSWSDVAPMTCNDCHSSPPANHFPGACTSCHKEANASGTALSGGPLHMNGKVDLGDGSGKCGACHGSGDSAWPSDDAHPAHQNPTIAAPVDCASCHPVPDSILAPGHLDAPLRVTLAGHALDRGAAPVWNGTTCSGVACHGAKLVDPPAIVPSWKDASGTASACGACHGIPPSQHTTSLSCDRSDCHGAEVTPPPSLAITTAGRANHINGVIDFASP